MPVIWVSIDGIIAGKIGLKYLCIFLVMMLIGNLHTTVLVELFLRKVLQIVMLVISNFG